ncbi:MAG: hypothetical protein H6R26_1127 [Proteobacteria bacterium]|nr:hypothetical protein [Pseudomonadota bacterium]
MKHRSGMFVCLALTIFCLGATSFAQMPGMGGGSGTFSGYQGHNVNDDLILPQVVVGQNYTTSLLLLNMGNSQLMNWVPAQNLITSGKVYFYRQDGTGLPVSVNGSAPASEFSFSLDPSKSAYYELSSTGSDTPGWALIDVDEPASGSGWGMMDGRTMTRGMRIMATVFYTYSGAGQPTSRVGVVPSMYEMGKFATSIISVQSNDDLYTGVAVVNTSAVAVTVTLRLKDSNGNVLATSPLSLNPGNQTAKFVHELFSSVLPADFKGFLEVSSSDEGIVTMGLLVSQGIMTSVPMAHYGQITMMP